MKILVIAWVSLLEALREKILYNVILFALLVFGVGFLAARLTFVQPHRVMLDFGLAAVEWSSVAVAALLSATGMLREIERKTVHVVISRPVTWIQFVIGKWMGTVLTVWIQLALLSALLIALLSYSGGEVGSSLHWALGLIALEAALVASVALFLSSFSTASLSVGFSLGLYLIGTNVSQLREVANRMDPAFVGQGLRALSWLLPNFEYFRIGVRVTYDLGVPDGLVIMAILYTSLVCTAAVMGAGVLVQWRER